MWAVVPDLKKNYLWGYLRSTVGATEVSDVQNLQQQMQNDNTVIPRLTSDTANEFFG